MLFDVQPKEKIRDFFDYKEELTSLVNHITDKSTRLVVIRGLRRTGKSSIIRVALHKTGVKHILIDARELTTLSRKSFEVKLLEELKTMKGIPASVLERLEGIDVGVRISLKKDEDSLWKLLKSLNPVIAVDEVQMLRGTGVDAFFSALYDNTGCKIVLTGSEIGVLDEFIGKDNPKAPLFGRSYSEIKMHQMKPEKSREFLVAGFAEADKRIPAQILDNALAELDGIIGWLVMFGNASLRATFEDALKNTIKTGSMLAYSELETFLNTRQVAKKRYLMLLRLLAEKNMRWTDIKRALQIELKESISDPQFSNYLNALTAYGFVVVIDNRYFIPDPLLKKALMGV